MVKVLGVITRLALNEEVCGDVIIITKASGKCYAVGECVLGLNEGVCGEVKIIH